MRNHRSPTPALASVSASILALAVAAPAAAQEDGLYPGEQRLELAGFPAIAHFTEGEPDRPLIVFAPGAHHTARIAYGGHEGGSDADFLAHWLAERGLNMLALTYPIDTEDGAIPSAHPEFTAEDWGRQIAEGVAAIREEHGLTGEVYLAAWSMAGKVVQPAHAALDEAGIGLDGAISLAATPGIPGIITMTLELDRTEDGYADRTATYDGWIAQIEANREGDEPIIPEDVYRSECVGHISINLQGYGEVYADDGEVRLDHMAQAEDYGAFAFDDFPLVAVLLVNDPADARHAMLDQAYWTLYNANTLFSRQLREHDVSISDLSRDQFQDLVALSLDAGERLSVDVGGNHFFFVGEEGARATAEALDEAIARLNDWRGEVEQVVAEQ